VERDVVLPGENVATYRPTATKTKPFRSRHNATFKTKTPRKEAPSD